MTSENTQTAKGQNDRSSIPSVKQDKIEKDDNGYDVEDVIEMPALGRPFRLGMLYNRINDSIIPGENLLPPNLPPDDIFTNDATGMNTVMILGDSQDDKSLAFDDDKSLQVNVLFGLTQTGCSGKNLTAEKASKNKIKASLGINVFSQYEEIDIPELYSKTNKHFFKKGTNATHIVAAIKYGGHVAFEFEMTQRKDESKNDANARLHDAVKCWKLFSGAEINKQDTKASRTDIHGNISCKFFGDTILPVIPSTYEESVQYIKNINSHFENKRAPVTVWLYPLSRILPRQTPALRKMMGNLESKKIIQLYDAIQELRIDTKGMMESPAAVHIPDALKILRLNDIDIQKMEQDLKEYVIERKDDMMCDSKSISKAIEQKQKWKQNAHEEIRTLSFYITELIKKDCTPASDADIEAKIFEYDKDELIHLTIYLPLLREELTSSEKRILISTLTNDETKRSQSQGLNKMPTLFQRNVSFEEHHWIQNQRFKTLLRKYVRSLIDPSANAAGNKKHYAITFKDIKSSADQSSCFHVDMYKSAKLEQNPNLNLLST